MNSRDQDKEITRMPSSSSSYAHHLIAEQSGGGLTDQQEAGLHNGGTTGHSNNHPPSSDQLLAVRSRSLHRTLSSSSSSSTVKYRECQKNHAANIGGNIYDGCGEFMPNGDEGSLEALKCAACDCHRNFHRKEVDGESTQLLLAAPTPNSRRSSNTTTHHHPMMHLNHLQLPPLLHHQRFSMAALNLHSSPSPHAPVINAPAMNVAYGGCGGTDQSSSEDLNHHVVGGPAFSLLKKRFRTKFSQEQKERMMEFAEKVGWRIQKQDEEEVERFCGEVGVKRQVLKVWMHNNKNAVMKRQIGNHVDHQTMNSSERSNNLQMTGSVGADDDNHNHHDV